MKLIAWWVRITWFVMSVVLCSVWFGFATGESISNTGLQSTAWDANITIPTVTEDATIAVANEIEIQPSFGGNGKASLDTQTQADTQLTLIAEPAYMCGQWFVGRVNSSNTNNASVLIRLSDLNGRTVVNLHPHVDSDGDYRQWINYHNESSMFYIASWYYQVLIVAYNGSSIESIVFDTHIGTDCPSQNQGNNGDNIDPQQPWDHNLSVYAPAPHNTGATANTNTNIDSANTQNQYKLDKWNTKLSWSQTRTSSTISPGGISLLTGVNADDLGTDKSVINTRNTSLDEWLVNDPKHKDDRYKWLIAAILWGGLIYYGAKMDKK